MQIRELLSKETVVIGLAAEDKATAIAAVIELLANHSAINDIEAVRAAVIEREELMSTGVGKGLALPHAKTRSVQASVAALAITKDPIEYDAVDGEPVRIIFLLVGPLDAKSQHVRILSRISRLMNRADVRAKFLSATSSAELLKYVEESESQLLSN